MRMGACPECGIGWALASRSRDLTPVPSERHNLHSGRARLTDDDRVLRAAIKLLQPLECAGSDPTKEELTQAEACLEPYRRAANQCQTIVRMIEPGTGVHLQRPSSSDDSSGRATLIPWAAYELVDGARTLVEAIGRNPWRQPKRTHWLLCSVCDAVQSIHEQQLRHGDLKPENVLVGPDDQVRLIDFDLSTDRLLQDADADAVRGLGTDGYMAPELRRGGSGPIGPWTDVYALGVLMHRVLGGRLDASPRLLESAPRSIRSELEKIIGDATAESADDRINASAMGNVQALIDRLESLRDQFDALSQRGSWDRPEFDEYLAERRERFTGRRSLFADIDRWLDRMDEDVRPLLIWGDPGIGKTAIIAKLAESRHDRVAAIHCCIADRTRTTSPGQFVHAVAGQLAASVPVYAEWIEAHVDRRANLVNVAQQDDGEAREVWRNSVLRPLQDLESPDERDWLVLVDALDESRGPSGSGIGPGIVDLLRAAADRRTGFPPWLRLLATCRDGDARTTLADVLHARELAAASSSNQADVATYIENRLCELPDSAAKAIGTDDGRWQTELERIADGNFLAARQVLDDLEHRFVDGELVTIEELQNWPSGLYGLYAQFLQRHMGGVRDVGSQSFRAVASIVLAQRAPLPTDLLRRALRNDGGAGVDPMPVLDELRAFVPHQGGCVRVYHKSFADWLLDDDRGHSYRIDATTLEDARESLARACLDAWKQSHEGGRRVDPDAVAYASEHLARHLAEADLGAELATLLLDHRWVRERVEDHGGIHALIGDYDAALGD